MPVNNLDDFLHKLRAHSIRRLINVSFRRTGTMLVRTEDYAQSLAELLSPAHGRICNGLGFFLFSPFDLQLTHNPPEIQCEFHDAGQYKNIGKICPKSSVPRTHNLYFQYSGFRIRSTRRIQMAHLESIFSGRNIKEYSPRVRRANLPFIVKALKPICETP